VTNAPQHAPARDQPLAPTIEHPYWRSPDGRRLAFAELASRATQAERERLTGEHVAAIAALELCGIRKLAAGEHSEARRLVTAAGRLCAEPIGHWPAHVTDSDHQ
jgi:hypothetical protein